MIRFLAALALSVAPAQAQMLDGADDPAFRAALTTLLAKDDPAAVASLRDLAEAGNPAALITLPFALQWVPPQGNLKEKNAQRMVGGVKAQDAAALAHGATALWNGGQAGSANDLPDRAAGLLAQGEPEKATFLLSAWLNQTGGFGALPAVVLTDDVPAWLGGMTLSSRLFGAVLGNDPSPETAALLLSQMREDRLAGWVAYVDLLDRYPQVFDLVGSPLAATGFSAADTEARIADARAVLAVSPVRAVDDAPTPAEVAARAHAVLTAGSGLFPLRHLCQAHCPDSLDSCETASLVYPGQTFGSFEQVQPFVSVIDPMEFAASERGLAALIPARNDPAAAADRATAEALDACYAGVLKRRDTLSFGP